MSDVSTQETNLGMVLADMNYGAHIPHPHQARIWAPALAKKLHYLRDHSHIFGISPVVGHMLGAWQRLVEKYEDVSLDLARYRQTATVWYSTQWQNIPPGTKSSIATSKVPYSGTAAMLRSIMLNSKLTPVGGFGDLNMAGIPFTDPTTNGSVVDYSTAPGIAGTPTIRWMDPTPFLHDKTAPWGHREVQFWVDWVLDPAAEILTSWVNPDPITPITVSVNYIFTSTPCNGLDYRIGRGGWWHRDMDPGVGTLMNQMAFATFGLAQGGLPVLPMFSSHGHHHDPTGHQSVYRHGSNPNMGH